MSGLRTRAESARLLGYLAIAPNTAAQFATMRALDPGRAKYGPTPRAPQNRPAPFGRTLSGLPKRSRS